MRYDFCQFIDIFLLVPDVSITETGRDSRKLASTDIQGAHDTREHGRVNRKREGVREGGYLGRL